MPDTGISLDVDVPDGRGYARNGHRRRRASSARMLAERVLASPWWPAITVPPRVSAGPVVRSDGYTRHGRVHPLLSSRYVRYTGDWMRREG